MQIGRLHTLLKDDRRDLRVKERGRIPWQIKYKQREGIAKIRNMSISGMLIETDTSFTKKDECIFSFDSDPKADIYIPQVGRLIWHKKKRFSNKKYLSGIKFLEADEQILTKMRSRVNLGIEKFVKRKRITITTGSILCAVFIGLIGFIVWYGSGIYQDVTTANQRLTGASGQQIALSQMYNNLYRASELKLAEAERKLAIANQLIQEDKAAIILFNKELEATKALLNQTEAMLIQSNDRNVEFQNDIQALRNQGRVRSSAQVLTDDEPIMSIADAESLMSTYRLRIRSVKNEIKRLKKVDRSARAAIVSQVDSQKLLLGNNGFFVKDGKVTQVDEKQYQSLTVNQSQGSVTAQSNKNVEIDITFFE